MIWCVLIFWIFISAFMTWRILTFWIFSKKWNFLSHWIFEILIFTIIHHQCNKASWTCWRFSYPPKTIICVAVTSELRSCLILNFQLSLLCSYWNSSTTNFSCRDTNFLSSFKCLKKSSSKSVTAFNNNIKIYNRKRRIDGLKRTQTNTGKSQVHI